MTKENGGIDGYIDTREYTMLWIKDAIKWKEIPLVEKLEALRLHYCTGPCGQSSSILATRSATDSALKEAMKTIDSLSRLSGSREDYTT